GPGLGTRPVRRRRADRREVRSMSTDERRGLSRRQLLRAALVGTGAAAMAGLLTACLGGGSTEVPAGGAASPAGGGTTGGAGAELTYWDWWVTQGPTIDAAIQRFQQANPTITVKKTTNAVDQYPDLFALAQRGGNGPDVFLIPQKPGFSEIVANGWLADLAQFPDYPAFVKTFPQPDYDFVEGANVIGGKTYSAPFTSPAEAMWNQLWFNTKVFKDAGIVDAAGNASPPQTLDELLDRARTIQQRSNGQGY